MKTIKFEEIGTNLERASAVALLLATSELDVNRLSRIAAELIESLIDTAREQITALDAAEFDTYRTPATGADHDHE